jgi:hypothetical protein
MTSFAQFIAIEHGSACFFLEIMIPKKRGEKKLLKGL